MAQPRKNDIIKLTPKTRHGKNRVREHGDTVRVEIVKESSFSTTAPDGDWRWIDNVNDRDFDWIIVK